MHTICKNDCCNKCSLKNIECKGCIETNGHPCGGTCVAAEYIKNYGFDVYTDLKNKLIEEINLLNIKSLKVSELYLLIGSFINIEYPLPNGTFAKFLKDNRVYFGNQIQKPDSNRCYGVVADNDILLICEYGENCKDPEIILFKNRKNSI